MYEQKTIAMKIKRLLSLLLLCFALFGMARADEVMIGDAASTSTQYYLPVNMYYNFSLTQQIYTAEEIGMAGTINSIAFDYATNSSFRMSGIQVYMMNVDKASFESADDVVSLANAELVWEGPFYATEAGWVTIDLDTPFAYDGRSNLLVCCYDPTNGYPGNSYKFRTTATTDYLSLAYYSDTYTPNPENLTSYNGSKYRFQYRTNIMLDITPSGSVVCDKPDSIEATNVTTNDATIVWSGGSGEYNVQYKMASDVDWIDLGYEVPYTSYHFGSHNNILEEATTYSFRVQSYCGTDPNTGDEILSGWKSINFTTACGVITTFPWTENFESYDVGNFVDPCWVNEHIEGAGSQIFKVNSSSSGIGGNTTKMLQLPDQAAGTMTKLVLPEMTLPANYEFSIDVYRSNNTWQSNPYQLEGIYVYASTDGEVEGATELAFIPRHYQVGNDVIPVEEAVGWYNYEIPIGMSGTCYIILKGVNQYVTATYMDNFAVKAMPSCYKPTGLTYANVTAHSATLSWTSDADAWQICINDDEDNLINVNETSYALTDLDEYETYTAKVRTNCGTDGYSEWSNVVSFTTPIACPAPTGLYANNITGHNATLNWTGSSDSYIVSYRTAAAAEGIYEEFNKSGIPSGWTKYTGLVNYVLNDSIQLTTGGNWNTTTYALGQYNMKLNIYGSSCRYWLVTPEFTVEQDLSFDLALTAYNTENPIANDTLQADDRFIVLIYANNRWTILREWNNSGSRYVYNAIPATGENVAIDLSDYYGQDVKIAFYGESTSSTDSNAGDNDLHIDNVFCGTPIPAGEWMNATTDTTTYTITGLNPETVYEVKVESSCPGELGHETAISSFTTDVACPAPTGLTAANIGPNTADLRWTSDADAWEVEVSYNTPAIVTTLTANTNPFTMTGLIPETKYSIRVRANCGNEGYSEWSSPVSFTTLEACPAPTDLEVSNVTYNSATLSWTGFNDSYVLNWGYGEKRPLLTEDFTNGIPANWTNDANYPFEATTDSITGNIFMMSSNAGVSSSISEISATMTYPAAGFIEFDAQCMGEGTAYDVCRFLIDGESVLSKGANGEQWDHYIFPVTEGEHTFTWRYSKDGSVNKPGDHFAVDNINMYWENIVWQDPITTEETAYTFNGLTPETNYYVKVQGICDGEPTEESDLIVFATPVLTALTQTVNLIAGANWFSTYLEITLDDLKAALVEALPGATNIVIKSKTQNAKYNGTSWRGNLTWDLSKMYLITVEDACEITLEGELINPEDHPATILGGQSNWIAFPVNEEMTLNTAFAGFNAVNGDVIKSKTGNAKYNGTSWRAQGLSKLEPGKGYLFNSAATTSRTLTFPASSK